jgi:hypothetical protein
MPPRAGETPRASEPPVAVKSDTKSDPAPAAPPQSVAMQAKPAELAKSPQNTAPAPIDTKPVAPQIQPTREMPKVQGLE